MKISHRSFAVACLLVSLISLPCSAANFTLEQVMSSPFPSNLVSAKRSGRVAWVFNAKGVRNLWIADAPNFAARQVTHYSEDDGVPISSLRITPDGRTLVYVRGSELNENGRVADPTNGVSARKQQVWAVDAEGGTPRLLGEMGCGEEDCEDVELSPDGQFAVWAAHKQLWIAPVSGATPAHQLTDLRGENSSPRWSPDGREIAFVSSRGDHSFIAVYDFGRDSVRYLAPSADRDVSPRWSPDGKRIAFMRLPGLQEKLPLIPVRVTPWAIWVADTATGNGKEIWHSGNTPNDSFPELTADSSFYFAANDQVLFASEQDGWNHLYSIPAGGGAPTLLTPGNFEVEEVTFKSEDGLEIHGQLFVPAERRQAGPALIFVHGGPIRQMMLGFHYMYYYHNAYAMNQYLAIRGYVVLSVNYRLGIMYGRAFREAANAGWRGSSEYKDVVAGAKYLQSLPIVDAKRIGLWGGSYGGLLTALGLARNSDIFAAGVDMHGVHDWSVFLPHWEKRPGAPDQKEAEKLAFESSPDASVATWKSPVLLIHGDDDRNVPFGQTVDLAQRLREQKVYFEELIFPDEIHDFLIWRNWVRAYKASVDFFAEELGQRASGGKP